MGCYWVAHATSGNPNNNNCDNVINWPTNDGAVQDSNMVFDAELSIGTGLSSAECDFWDSGLQSWVVMQLSAYSPRSLQLDTTSPCREFWR